MNPRTGLGLVETALLAAVADLGGTAGAGHLRSDRVLEWMEREHAVGPRYAYAVLVDLAVPWRLHLPLLDVEGNTGSQHGDPPADAQYTRVRLTPVGELAVAAERGELGPVPLGLVEGSLYREGRVPPFDPRHVVTALTDGSGDAGAPSLPTGGEVGGDVAGLLAGRAVRLQLSCAIVREPGALVVTEVPLGVGIDLLERSLVNRVAASRGPRHRDHLPGPPIEPVPAPVVEVRDETSMLSGVRVVLRLAEGADPDEAERWARYAWPVTTEVDCLLPQPMPTRLRDWDRGDGSGLVALAGLLA